MLPRVSCPGLLPSEGAELGWQSEARALSATRYAVIPQCLGFLRLSGTNDSSFTELRGSVCDVTGLRHRTSTAPPPLPELRAATSLMNISVVSL